MSAWGLMAASGFAGLGWQIVWTQQLALWLGHESAAVLAVLAAFFGGLALGALGLGGRIARSARPGAWYAGCEAVIAVWGLVLIAWMPQATQRMLALIGPQPGPLWQWGVALGASFVLLLPATAAMGATLPAMARVAAALRLGGAPVAALYAANTAGAVLGVLAAALWLVPGLGLWRTGLLCAGLNAACALLAWRLWHASTALPPAAHPGPGSGPRADRRAGRAVLARLAATGALGIAYEVAVVRVISQVAEDTVYTFALLLAVYLVGTALGAAAWARWGRHGADADAAAQADRLLPLLAGACLLGAGSLWAADGLKAATLASLGPGLGPALAAEALLAVAAFALPTLVMGALFSHLAEQAGHGGHGLGRALGVNTLGAALAPAVVGVGLLPLTGAKPVLLGIAAGYLLLLRPRQWARPLPWVPAVAVALLALAAPPLVYVEQPEGGQLLSYQEGAMAAVSVVADAQGVARLRINNRQQEGSSSSLQADGRQALLPLLLHPAPRSALFLGLGTGLTASAAVQDRSLQVDAVELLPEVAAAATLFQPAWADPTAAGRLQVQVADARRHVRTAARHYDLIVADNFHPARSGSGALYTVEHFQAVRARLADGGLFCQWLPLHQLDEATLRSIVASFLAAFPQGQALLASHSLETPVIGLLGASGGPLRVDPQQVRQRLAAARAWPRPPAAFGLHDEWAVLGSVLAGPDALARLAAGAALNTDDRPVVAYRAPRVTYAPDGAPRERLLALLPRLALQPGELLAPRDAGAEPRLAAYRAARDRYLRAGRDARPSSDVRQMLAQVGAPLLEVLRASPDFRPAYEPLLGMAQALAAQDAAAARALLAQLARLQPAWPEASELLQAL